MGSSSTMKLGVHGERAGDADALALAAGELVHEAVGVLAVQAHHLQAAVDLVLPLLLGGAQLVDVDALGDDVGHRHARVERAVRILEDHLHLALELLTVLAGERVDVLALVEHLAIGLVVQADAGAPARGLAAAGLAHHAQGLALVDVERDVVHGLEHGVAAHVEYFFRCRTESSTSFPALIATPLPSSPSERASYPAWRPGAPRDGAASRRRSAPLRNR